MKHMMIKNILLVIIFSFLFSPLVAMQRTAAASTVTLEELTAVALGQVPGKAEPDIREKFQFLSAQLRDNPEVAIQRALEVGINDITLYVAYLQILMCKVKFMAGKENLPHYGAVFECMELIKRIKGKDFLGRIINFQNRESCFHSNLLLSALEIDCTYDFFLYLLDNGANLTTLNACNKGALFFVARRYINEHNGSITVSDRKKQNTTTILIHLLSTPGLNQLLTILIQTENMTIFDALLLKVPHHDIEVVTSMFTSPDFPAKDLSFLKSAYVNRTDMPAVDFENYRLIRMIGISGTYTVNPLYFLAFMGDYEHMGLFAEKYPDLITVSSEFKESPLTTALTYFGRASNPLVKERYRKTLMIMRAALEKKKDAKALGCLPKTLMTEIPRQRCVVAKPQPTKKVTIAPRECDSASISFYVCTKQWDACLAYLAQLADKGFDMKEILNSRIFCSEDKKDPLPLLYVAVKQRCPYDFFMHLCELGAVIPEKVLGLALDNFRELQEEDETPEALEEAKNLIIYLLNSTPTLKDINGRFIIGTEYSEDATIAMYLMATRDFEIIYSLLCHPGLNPALVKPETAWLKLSIHLKNNLIWVMDALQTKKPSLKKLPTVPADKCFAHAAALIADPVFAEQVCLSDDSWLIKKTVACGPLLEAATPIDIALLAWGKHSHPLAKKRCLATLDILVKHAVKKFPDTPLTTTIHPPHIMGMLEETIQKYQPTAPKRATTEVAAPAFSAATAGSSAPKERKKRVVLPVDQTDDKPQPAAGRAMTAAEEEALAEMRRLEDEENARREAQIEQDRLQREAAARALAEQEAADERERTEQAELARELEHNAAERAAQEQEVARINRLRARNARKKANRETRHQAEAEAARQEEALESNVTRIQAALRGKQAEQLTADRAQQELTRLAEERARALEQERERQAQLREEQLRNEAARQQEAMRQLAELAHQEQARNDAEQVRLAEERQREATAIDQLRQERERLQREVAQLTATALAAQQAQLAHQAQLRQQAEVAQQYAAYQAYLVQQQAQVARQAQLMPQHPAIVINQQRIAQEQARLQQLALERQQEIDRQTAEQAHQEQVRRDAARLAAQEHAARLAAIPTETLKNMADSPYTKLFQARQPATK